MRTRFAGSLLGTGVAQGALENLEVQLQRKLSDSRVAVCRRDRAEARVCLRLLWIAKVRMIEHIEELGAELQLQRLVNREDPDYARVP